MSVWWKRGAWICGAIALALTVSAAQNGLESGGNAAVLIAVAMAAANAGLWWAAAAGMRTGRRWSLHLAVACGILNLAQGIAVALSADAGARALAEQGLAARDSLFTAALGWVPAIGSAALLATAMMIRRGGGQATR
jgi:hypothetical protein